MIGKINNTLTVRKLYDYAVTHGYIDTDVSVVLDIISKESNECFVSVEKVNLFESVFHTNSNVCDKNSVSIDSFPKFDSVTNNASITEVVFKDYSFQDVMDLLNT